MKKTVKKENVNFAKELSELIDKRKKLEKREKELKNFFKSLLLDSNAMQIGDFVLTLDDCKRSSFDNDLLKDLLGPKIDDYKKVTHYKKLDIKKAA